MIWVHTLPEIGVQIDSKPSLEANLFLEPFLNTLEGAGVEVNNPKMTFQGGGMREPKEGVTMSHAFQAPFHGAGGYIYIYIHIYIYTLHISFKGILHRSQWRKRVSDGGGYTRGKNTGCSSNT